MRTRPKALLAVSFALAILFSCLAGILSWWLTKDYQEFERQSVESEVVRLQDVFNNRREDLYTKLGDWAQWDDTYNFVQNHNQEYIDSNLQNPTFDILKIHVVAILDRQGEVVFAKRVENQKEIDFPVSLVDVLKESKFRDDNNKEGTSGLVVLPQGVLLFALRPVFPSDGSGTSDGQILFGRFLNDEDTQSLTSLMHFSVVTHTIDESLVADKNYGDIVRASQKKSAVVPEVDSSNSLIRGYTSFLDGFTGQPALLLEAQLPRDIFLKGKESIRIFLQMMIVAGACIIAIVAGMFEFIVLRRLLVLEKSVSDIRQKKEERSFLDLPKTNDEFGSLEQEINQTLASLYRSETKLEEQRNELKKFQLAADKSFNHLIITDAEGVIVYANEAASKNTGYSIDEMIGDKPSLWGKQMPRELYERMWRAIKEEKKPFEGELTNKHKDGTLYLVSANISPIVDNQGLVRYFVGIERDITEERSRQKRDQENVRQLETVNSRLSSEKARAEGILRYLRSIAGGVYATDRRGTIVFINDAAAEFVGEKSENILGKDAAQFFQFCEGMEEKKVCVLTQQVLAVKRSLTFPQDTFLTRPQKEPLPVTGTVAPIVEQKHIAGVIVVFQDMTDFYKLEKMKESFLSIAAHQLRTPLGSMRWSMELLLHGDVGKIPRKAHDVLLQLYENSNRMLTVVRDLLNVSKINQGKTHEVPLATDVLQLVQQVVETMTAAAQKKNIALKLLPSKEELPKLIVTKKHLFEAIENVVANAVCYSRENGEVTVKIYREGTNVVIAVTDTGIGIPKADQNKIFSKFYRASNAVKYLTDGSGLGLAVVKSYVEENKGTVRFESKENVGTTFFLCLPLEATKNERTQ